MLKIEQPKFPVIIRRIDKELFTFYSLSDRKKNLNGEYEYGNLPCKFKKGVEIKGGTKIYIKSCYIDWWKKGYQTNLILFITDFITAEEKEEEDFKEEAFESFNDELSEENFDFDDLGF